MFERNVEKITGAASRVEDRDVAQVFVKAAQFDDRARLVAGINQFNRGSLDRFPIGTQRLDDRRQHQALDIGAGRVMGAEPFAFALVE